MDSAGFNNCDCGDMTSSVRCTFIIVNFNDSKTTETLVDKLVVYSCIEKIIIVDNKSLDNSYLLLNEKYKRTKKVALLQSGKNGGYSYGNNCGIDYFFENNFCSEFVVISNPDIFITENDLNELLKIAKSDLKIGAIAPMMNIAGLNTFKVSAWKQPSYFYDFLRSVPYFRRFAEKLICYKQDYFTDDLVQVDVIPGSFIVISKTLLSESMRFDDRFFLFCEERILCEKIRKLTYKIMIATKLKYEHFESVSIKKSYSKASARERLLNDSKKKYYRFYKSNNYIRNFLLFVVMDINLVLTILFHKIRNIKWIH